MIRATKSIPNEESSQLSGLSGSLPALPPLPSGPEGPKATEADLLGAWKASRDNGSAYELTLTANGEFTWSWSSGNQQRKIQGVFAVDDGVLAMEPDSGGVMLANVTKQDTQAFVFQQVGDTQKIQFQKTE